MMNLLTIKLLPCEFRCSYDLLAKEKEDLEAEFHEYRRQVETTTDGDVAKELRMLRNMVRSLEDDRRTSQAKYQRMMMKRGQQCRLLIDEVMKNSFYGGMERLKSVFTPHGHNVTCYSWFFSA